MLNVPEYLQLFFHHGGSSLAWHRMGQCINSVQTLRIQAEIIKSVLMIKPSQTLTMKYTQMSQEFISSTFRQPILNIIAAVLSYVKTLQTST